MVNQLFFEQDILKEVRLRPIHGSLFEGDNEGLQVGVKIFRNRVPENLSGTILCEVVRDDGTMALVDGVKSGNLAYVAIKSNCLMPGTTRITLKNMVGTQKTTILAITGTVVMVNGSAFIDTGSVVPDLSAYTTLTQRIETAATTVSGLTTSAEVIAGDRYKCIVTKG